MTDSAEEHYVVISADCHGGADIADYRPYLESRYHDDFDAWAATFENPYDDIAGRRRRPQLGLGPPAARDGGRRRRRRGDLPQHHPAVLPQGRRSCTSRPARARATSNGAGRGCGPTTAGSPTSAPTRRAGGPASARSCCTTSTDRSPRSVGGRARPHRRRPAAGRAAGFGRPAAVRARLRADLAGVRGARPAGQPPQRQRGARHGRVPGGAGRCSCSRSPGGRTARSGT